MGAGDFGFGEAAVGGAGLADDDGVFVFGDEEGVDEVAVFEFDAVDAVAGFHGGVGGEDVAEDGFEAHGADAGEVGADLSAGVADLVAGEAEGGVGFAGGGVAFGGEGGEFGELGIEGEGLFGAEEGRGVEGFGEAGAGFEGEFGFEVI